MGTRGVRRRASGAALGPLLASLSLLLVALAQSLLAQEALRIAIKEGAGAVVPRQTFSSRRFTVQVIDPSGRPVSGATVHFRLPSEGPTGTFSSGMRSETTVTNAEGMATAYGIQWGSQPGSLGIRVIATDRLGRRGEADIPVEISSHRTMAREDRANPSFRAPSSGKKWLIIALVGAGAAAGASLAGRSAGGAATYAPPAPVVVPPSIGTPTITVGKP